MHRDFVETLAELEITQKQVATLVLISANPGVSQIQIAGQQDDRFRYHFLHAWGEAF